MIRKVLFVFTLVLIMLVSKSQSVVNNKHRLISPHGNPFFLTPFVNATIYKCLEMITDRSVAACGVTYFTSSQKSVFSMSSGRVSWVGSNGAYILIGIKTDSAIIVYNNMEKVFIKEGDSIGEGQILGEAYKGLRDSRGHFYHKDDYVTGIEMSFKNSAYKRLEKSNFIIRQKDD